MGLCVRFVLPVVALAAVAAAAVLWAGGGTVTAGPLGLVLAAGLAVAGAACLQARALLRALGGLPGLVRATAWGEREGDFPDVGGGPEIARLRAGLGDLANDMAREIEERAKMERMALTDPLTGLPNRRGLFEFFARLADGGATGEPQPIGVMHLDLDHFKAVNDMHGHDAGDHVLREATRRMATAIRDTDLLARLGGDEFVIVAPQVENEWVLERIAERIIALFDEPMVYHDVPCRIGASIGIVLGGQRGKVLDPARLLINADIALCHAKTAGRGRHALFTSSMARAAQTRACQADEIRDGIAAGAFHPWFQPVISCASGAMTAVEITPRWHHPALGVLAPRQFVDAAEAHNLIEDLGHQVVERAFALIQGWRRQGHAVPALHLATSRAQLMSPAWIDKLTWTMDEANLVPADVAIQIAEPHCAGRGIELVLANLDRLRGMGFAIVLDAFGAESASVATLTRLEAGVLKPAAHLTAALTGGPADDRAAALMLGVLGLGERLGIEIVARAVDGAAARAALDGLGCRAMQGDVFAPLMDGAAMAAWLKAEGEGPSAKAASG